MKILVINSGSSSLKYQLFDMNAKKTLAKGLCERIGMNDGIITYNYKNKYSKKLYISNHSEAIKIALSMLCDVDHGVLKSIKEIDAVGHRMVHGGEKISSSVIIDDDVINIVKECTRLAPLHNPANLIGIEACKTLLGKNILQVGVFDTAFHQTIPDVNYIYGIPYKYYKEDKIRKYGFHGTSHRYVANEALKLLNKKSSKIITCHLGNGSSITAIQNGISYDTSMGFTPLDGIPMGTRCGSIDPSIIEFLNKNKLLTIEKIFEILNKQSGMLGISEISSDFRDIENAILQNNYQALLAKKIFYQNIKKYVGSYVAIMGGLDAIVFTAGIGENHSETREKVCENMDFLGMKIDINKNKKHGIVDVSAYDSKVKIYVIPTNEELVIAEDTMKLLKKTC